MRLNKNNVKMFVRETSELIHLNKHYHNHYELIFVEEGICEFEIDQKHYVIDKPSLVFINHLENHSMNVIKAPYKTFYLIIQKETIQTLLEEPILYSIFKYRPENYRHVIELTEETNQIVTLIHGMYDEFKKQHPLSVLAFKSHIQYLFILLYRNYQDYFPTKIQTQINYTVLDVQEYIDMNYFDDIGLESIAEMFFISPSYLSRSFKDITGYNLKQYIILQRLSKAKELLLYSHDNLLEICAKSGFNNVNHFIRSFKNLHGITPNEYRLKEKEHIFYHKSRT